MDRHSNRRTLDRSLRLVTAFSCAWFFAAPAAQADAPALNAQQLGITESVLKYCGPVDPASAKKLQATVDELVKGAGDSAVEQARGSEEYRKGRALMEKFIAQVDEHNAKVVCSDTAASGK